MVFNHEIMEPLFWLLEQTRGIEQNRVHHPEGDVLTHSLQVLDMAFKESIDTDLIIAAMMHDVGKIGNSKGHEKIAVELLDCHCSGKTLWLIKNHMRFWYFVLGEMRKRGKILELFENPWIADLMLLARWDKIGRNPNRKVIFDKNRIMEKLNMCVKLRFPQPKKQPKGK